MADTYDTQDVADRAYGVPRDDLGGTLRVATNLIGAAISLGLVIGVAIWGYKLLVRDVTGIPVVRALEGPMRVQPENPGGDAADHQGLAVNAVAADGTAAPPADTLILAPRPVDLTGEDQPRVDLARVVSAPQDAAPAPTQSAEIDDLIAQLVGPREDGAGPIVQPAPLVFENVTPQPFPRLPRQPPLPPICPASRGRCVLARALPRQGSRPRAGLTGASRQARPWISTLPSKTSLSAPASSSSAPMIRPTSPAPNGTG